MKAALAVLALVSPFAMAADITLEANGKEVDINGTSVVCLSQLDYTAIKDASYEVVVGMAKAGKLGNCRVSMNMNNEYEVYLYEDGRGTLVKKYTSEIDTAAALRGYAAAGACR